MNSPLVTLLTPTYNRRKFFPQAIQCFQSQDYPNIEWVILDDGTEPIKDLLSADSRINYFHSPTRKNHGAKMNRCCELASGEYAVVFDDDDFYPSDRVRRLVEPLIANAEMRVSGTSVQYCYSFGTRKAYKYTSDLGWLAAIAFPLDEWRKQGGFQEIPNGADWEFQKSIPVEKRVDLLDPSLVVSSMHNENAGKRKLNRSYVPVPWEVLNVEA